MQCDGCHTALSYLCVVVLCCRSIFPPLFRHCHFLDFFPQTTPSSVIFMNHRYTWLQFKPFDLWYFVTEA